METLAHQPVAVDLVRPLRHKVLRPGRPWETAIWDGDDDPATRHFAALDAGVIVGVATLLRRPHDCAPDARAWQLRGMATEPALQGRGVGSGLLTFLLDYCRDHDAGTVIWCNARIRAADFYRRHGFTTVGPEFVIAGVGPHYVMRRSLTPAPNC